MFFPALQVLIVPPPSLGGALFTINLLMGDLHNRSEMKLYRRKLRSNMTNAEVLLWTRLKALQLGVRFKRQHSVGRYILDFYCPSQKLAIELDGKHHYSKKGMAYDQIRTDFLNTKGIQVVRFPNEAVIRNLQSVVTDIKSHLEPSPPSEGGETYSLYE